MALYTNTDIDVPQIELTHAFLGYQTICWLNQNLKLLPLQKGSVDKAEQSRSKLEFNRGVGSLPKMIHYSSVSLSIEQIVD